MRKLIAIFIMCVAGSSHAQEPRIMSPEEGSKFEARLRGWAKSTYPAMMTAKQLPDDILLAFLVDPNDVVLKHTVGFKGPEGATVPEELARFFPGRDVSEFKHHGAGCLVARGSEPRYCVMYATVPK
jgi:hypothetical protein